jgi:hypothetical protein
MHGTGGERCANYFNNILLTWLVSNLQLSDPSKIHRVLRWQRRVPLPFRTGKCRRQSRIRPRRLFKELRDREYELFVSYPNLCCCIFREIWIPSAVFHRLLWRAPLRPSANPKTERDLHWRTANANDALVFLYRILWNKKKKLWVFIWFIHHFHIFTETFDEALSKNI